MIVAKISAEKAEELKGQEFEYSNLFNPVQDINDNWIVSLVEAQHLLLSDILEWIEFEPKEGYTMDSKGRVRPPKDAVTPSKSNSGINETKP